jgi:hypothetical protein
MRVNAPKKGFTYLEQALKGLDNTMHELIVVGNIAKSKITSGDPFIVSDQDNAGLVKSLQDSENTQRNISLSR